MVILFAIMLAYLLIPIEKSHDENSYLNKQASNCIKGLAAILVVYAHAAGYFRGQYDTISFYLMNNLGFLSVGIFYMLSGYGLMYSFKTKENYLKGYFKNRILKVLIPFWIVNLFYLAFSILVEHKTIDMVHIFKYMLGLELISGHLWFVPGIVILYFIFWICCKIIPERKFQFCMMIVVFSIFNVYMNLKITMFLIGIIIAYIGCEKIYNYTYNHINKCCLITGIVFLIMYFWYANMNMTKHFVIDKNITECICQIFLCIFIVLLTGILSFNCKRLNIIGKISYEIFLIHRLVLNTLNLTNLNIIIFLLVGVVISIILGYIFSLLLNKVRNVK